MIEAGSNITSEAWLLRSDDPTGEFRVVWPRVEGVEYDVEHAVVGGDDRLLIVHNDGAVNFELVSVAADDPQGPRRVLLPHDPAVRLEGVDAFRDFVGVEYRRDGLTRVAVARVPDPRSAEPTDDTPHELALRRAAVHGRRRRQPRVDAAVRCGSATAASSRRRPSTTTTCATGELRAAQAAARARRLRPDRCSSSAASGRPRRTARASRSRSSTAATWSTPGEPAPLVLYGYGSYEASMDPSFGIPRLSAARPRRRLRHRARARRRRDWAGSGTSTARSCTRSNTFTDFVDAARHLIDERLDRRPTGSSPQGGSAGGLLMGAVANLAPELLRRHPRRGAVRRSADQILDPSLPLTVIEWDEWGDPLHDAEVYALHEVVLAATRTCTQTHYPRILAVTSLNDTRVLYVEPAKWVARLREVGADALLKIEMAAGHGGVSGRYTAWRERAFAYAWVIAPQERTPAGSDPGARAVTRSLRPGRSPRSKRSARLGVRFERSLRSAPSGQGGAPVPRLLQPAGSRVDASPRADATCGPVRNSAAEEVGPAEVGVPQVCADQIGTPRDRRRAGRPRSGSAPRRFAPRRSAPAQLRAPMRSAPRPARGCGSRPASASARTDSLTCTSTAFTRAQCSFTSRARRASGVPSVIEPRSRLSRSSMSAPAESAPPASARAPARPGLDQVPEQFVQSPSSRRRANICRRVSTYRCASPRPSNVCLRDF